MTIGPRSIDHALRWLGLSVWAVTVGLTGTCLGLRVTSSAPPLENRFGMTDAGLLGFGILQIACASAAVLIVARIPRNLVAWLLFGIGLSYAVATTAAAWVFDAATRPGTADLAEMAWLNQTAGLIPGVLTALLILVYPRPLRGRRSVVVAATSALVFSLLGVVIPAVNPGPLWFWETVDNPFGVGPRLIDDLATGRAFQPAVLATGLVICSAWIGWRYRHSGQLERLQLKWFASAALISMIALGVVGVAGALGRGAEAGWWSLLIYAIAGSSVPIAICIAILRYHLYAIETLVNRVLVYSAVTASLGAVFGLLVVLVGGALATVTTEFQTVAVAISTLVVASLFNPVRHRIQEAVDRRFDRARYDAAKTVEDFAGRLRQTVDLEELEAEMVEVVRQTLRPTTAGMWLGRSR